MNSATWGRKRRAAMTATPTQPKVVSKGTVAPIALDARAVVRVAFGDCLSLRNWRSMDSAGKTPAGFKVGGRKLWRMRDLERWAHWEFPARPEFQRRLAELDRET